MQDFAIGAGLTAEEISDTSGRDFAGEDDSTLQAWGIPPSFRNKKKLIFASPAYMYSGPRAASCPSSESCQSIWSGYVSGVTNLDQPPSEYFVNAEPDGTYNSTGIEYYEPSPNFTTCGSILNEYGGSENYQGAYYWTGMGGFDDRENSILSQAGTAALDQNGYSCYSNAEWWEIYGTSTWPTSAATILSTQVPPGDLVDVNVLYLGTGTDPISGQNAYVWEYGWYDNNTGKLQLVYGYADVAAAAQHGF